MKFKTKEDLKYQQVGMKSYGQGIEDSFTSFKQRIDFYERYSVAGVSFRNKFPKDYNEFDKLLNQRNLTNPIAQNCAWLHWLFKYCFGDIE